MEVRIYNKTKGQYLTPLAYSIEKAIMVLVDRATITIKPSESVNAGDEIQVRLWDGTTESIFWGGFALTSGKILENGLKEIEVNGYPFDILNKKVEIEEVNKSPEEILANALSGTGYSFNCPQATGIALDKYSLKDSYKVLFREMMETSGYVLRMEHSTKTIYLEPEGYLNSGYSFDSASTPIKFYEWKHEDIRTIKNRVRVVGNREIPILGVDEFNALSYSDYYNVASS